MGLVDLQKFRGRWYQRIPVADVDKRDVVVYVDGGVYTRFVQSVSMVNVVVHQPHGFKPKTRRVLRGSIKEAWRARSKLHSNQDE